jgi:hypothetical protein
MLTRLAALGDLSPLRGARWFQVRVPMKNELARHSLRGSETVCLIMAVDIPTVVNNAG